MSKSKRGEAEEQTEQAEGATPDLSVERDPEEPLPESDWKLPGEGPGGDPDDIPEAARRKAEQVIQELENQGELMEILLSEIDSGEQPRKFVVPDDKDKKLVGLCDSIRLHGLRQPPTVRRKGSRFEIVIGERRVRACRLAGHEKIPAFVVEIGDESALDIQVIENLEREDLAALDLAAAFKRMMDPPERGGFGRTVDQVAEKIGKSKGYVYGLVKLLDLCPEGQSMVRLGQMLPSVGQAIARIPDHNRQRKCIAELENLRAPIAEDAEERDPISYRAAVRKIQEEFALPLNAAPFDTKDDMLTQAGPCAKCPFNSLNQPGDLFSHPNQRVGKGYCLNSDCYQEKGRVSWQNRSKPYKEAGKTVLPLSKGRDMYKHGGALRSDSPYVELNAPCSLDDERRTWRKLLGDNCPAISVAADLSGHPRELVDREAATLAMAQAGHKGAKKAAREEVAGEAQQKSSEEQLVAFERRRQVQKLVAAELRDKVVARVEKKGFAAADLTAIASLLINRGEWTHVVERRGIKTGFQGLVKKMKSMTDRELCGLIMDLLISDSSFDSAEDVAKATGLDLKEIEKRVSESVDTAGKYEAEKAKEAEAEKPPKAEKSPKLKFPKPEKKRRGKGRG